MSEERNGADVNLELGGQKLNVKNVKSLNTGLTIISVVLVAIVLVLMFQHQVDAKDDNRALLDAIKENTASQKAQVAAQREANCLSRLTPEQKRDRDQLDYCRTLGKY